VRSVRLVSQSPINARFSAAVQVKKWMAQQQTNVRALSEPYIVSRYIDNPLLIGGRKFDLRLYVAVTSYRPLKAYMSELGFARFCNSQYSYEIGDLDNTEVRRAAAPSLRLDRIRCERGAGEQRGALRLRGLANESSSAGRCFIVGEL
jgi:hypothetical protein